MPLRVTRGALDLTLDVLHAPPRRYFIPLLVYRWNDLSDSVFDGVGIAGFKRRANAF